MSATDRANTLAAIAIIVTQAPIGAKVAASA
jgi:hypothetical protein